MTTVPILGMCCSDFGDSAYDHPDSCMDYTNVINIQDSSIASNTGGSCKCNIKCGSTMYDKFMDAFKYTQGHFLVENNLWAEFVRLDALSNCWVGVEGGNELVQLSLPELQFLSRYFTIEAPLGFLVINCMTQTCFHICSLGNIQHCGLRSACHFLRNYPRQTIGFVLTQSENKVHKEISIIQCAKVSNTFCDRYNFHIAQFLSDRLMKVIIGSFDHVVFRRGHF